MGIDVGFATTRLTTGIAFLDRDQLRIGRTKTTWESREAIIPHGFQPSIIAIDAPLLPLGADEHFRRHVEAIFIRAPFHNPLQTQTQSPEIWIAVENSLQVTLALNLVVSSQIRSWRRAVPFVAMDPSWKPFQMPFSAC